MIIKESHSRLLKIVTVFLALLLIIVALFLLGNTFDVSSPPFLANDVDNGDDRRQFDAGFLPLLFHDLITVEGILRTDSKAAFLVQDNQINANRIIEDKYSLDFISIPDLDRQREIPDGYFDVIVAGSLNSAQEFIDRTLKIGGIVAVNLDDKNSLLINKPHDYKIVYLRKFQSPYIAMKRLTGGDEIEADSGTNRRKLLGLKTEEKKKALNKLEKVLLEPPRAASGRSRRYLKKTRFLPDLTGDSLMSYPRRVFIDVGPPEREGGSGTGWFAKKYPTRNLDFEMYKIETVAAEEMGMSDWLGKNVKEEDYVVMKAEVEVVEEMMESKAIRMVDELFMECKPRGHGGFKRAYWECLAFYGRLRDEGVAVHQWWG